MKFLSFFFFLLFLAFGSRAQNNSRDANAVPSLQLLAQYKGDSVVLRWAPASSTLWPILTQGVYTVERSLYSKDTSKVLKEPYQKLTTGLQCLSLEAMKQKLGPGSEYGAIAAQALYGKVTNPGNGKVGALNNAAIDRENRFSFALFAADQDAAVAQSMGLRYVDKNIQKGVYYVYRVYTVHSQSDLKVDTAYVVVSTMPQEGGYALPTLEATSLEKSVRLHWLPEHDYFSGYFLEKRKKGTTSWIRLNKQPMVRTLNEENPGKDFFYTDSLGVNYQSYEYRLVAKTPFADLVTSTQTITAFGKDLTPPNPVDQVKVNATPEYTARITWKINSRAADLNAFHVQKAFQSTGPFETVNNKSLSIQSTEYTDAGFDPAMPTYYRVVAVDTAGNAAVSLSVYAYFPDDQAPTAPKINTGKVTPKGIVTVSWRKCKEKDVKGYRVYRANQADHEFINITPYPITDTFFVDTIRLQTLTKKIYYKIAAVDFHFNHSPLSEAIELKRPDIVKPANPVFNAITVLDSLVELSWHPSPSDDVLQTKLLRQESASVPIVLASFKGNAVSSYQDTKVLPGKKYRYFLLAVDDAQLSSDTSKPVDAYIYQRSIAPPVKDLTVIKHPKSKSHLIQWKYPQAKSGVYYVIYRQINDGPSIALGRAQFPSVELEDWDTFEKGIYQYSIAVFYASGLASSRSEPRKIEVQ